MKSFKSFTNEELDKLLAVAAKYSERDAMMIRVAYNHGLRASEVINLGPDNLVGRQLVVKRLKKSMVTSQELLDGERDYLVEQLSKGQPFLMDRTTFWRKIQRYGTEAGIDPTKCHPHTLKHTAGRQAYENGLGLPEIREILGHVEPGNTLRYMQADPDKSFAAFAAKCGK